MASVQGTDPSGGWAWVLDETVPCLATAIHAGGRVRPEIAALMTLDEAGRFTEEDPGTDRFIEGCPSRIVCHDSRYEYELNRSVERAVRLSTEDAWGRDLYREAPSREMLSRSRERHEAFYAFLEPVVRRLAARHGICVIYDIHSYSLGRQRARGFDPPPLFNVGTECLDRVRFGAIVDAWSEALAAIEVPGVETTVAENLIFFGRGEFCRRASAWDPRVLVLPTEVGKYYMDEETGQMNPARVEALARGFERAIHDHMATWMNDGVS